MQFLIVDDSDEPLKVLRRLLTRMGHNVVGSARNGRDAVTEHRRLRPDVTVMDVIMPNMDGLEALQAIRAADPQACVVMACSVKSCTTALECERTGASYFLTKPFAEESLRRVIDRIAADLNGGSHPPDLAGGGEARA